MRRWGTTLEAEAADAANCASASYSHFLERFGDIHHQRRQGGASSSAQASVVDNHHLLLLRLMISSAIDIGVKAAPTARNNSRICGGRITRCVYVVDEAHQLLGHHDINDIFCRYICPYHRIWLA